MRDKTYQELVSLEVKQGRFKRIELFTGFYRPYLRV